MIEVSDTSLFILLALIAAIGCIYYFGVFCRARDRMRKSRPAEGSAARSIPPPFLKPSQSPQYSGDCRPVVVLHGSLRNWRELLELGEPAIAAGDTVEAINDYLNTACHRIEHSGGVFERTEGISFFGIWGTGAPGAESGEAAGRALQCALELRRDFAAMNEARKIDGHSPLWVGMGLHSGRGLVGRMGPGRSMALTAIGDSHACASFLGRTALVEGLDLLVSEDIWELGRERFLGARKGESKLSETTGLTGYFAIDGYRDEKGDEVIVRTPYSVFETERTRRVAAEASVKKWLVNNGSQILGPYTAEEIAARLYAQEMDFDCECWVDGTGKSSQIAKAGIFTGSDDEEATVWVYDGSTVHGPLSKGFLHTALSRGAISPESWVCEGSTVEGWVPLASWCSRNAPVLVEAA